ncbi:MAG: hypothetical protein IJ668_00780 [Selenomonadaceae bacterium]|nr:hypothetical protein [Selenomonadaceae bacterium]
MSDGIKLDENKIKVITLRILEAEQDNLRTREKNDDAMVEKIRRMLIDEVNKRVVKR